MQQNKDLAKRYNHGKLEWSLIDFESLEPLVEVLMYGKNKYNETDEDGNIITSGRDNWKKGFYIDKLLDSTFRHLFEFSDGKDYDDESKLDLIGHIMCNLMFISYNLKHHPELDNRNKKEMSKKIMSQLEQTKKMRGDIFIGSKE